MDYRYRRQRKGSQSQDSREQETTESRLRRAKLKALRLLERSDRTESQLTDRLLRAGFEQEEAAAAVEYVKSFGYLDDERFVRNYLENGCGKKSRSLLAQELRYRAGASEELIQKVCGELEPADEKEMIRDFLEKKGYDRESCDEKQKRRLMSALLRRGFRTGDILSVMGEDIQDTP